MFFKVIFKNSLEGGKWSFLIYVQYYIDSYSVDL